MKLEQANPLPFDEAWPLFGSRFMNDHAGHIMADTRIMAEGPFTYSMCCYHPGYLGKSLSTKEEHVGTLPDIRLLSIDPQVFKPLFKVPSRQVGIT